MFIVLVCNEDEEEERIYYHEMVDSHITDVVLAIIVLVCNEDGRRRAILSPRK